MIDNFSIAVVQLNPTVGDVVGNTKKALAKWQEAKDKGARLVAFSELVVLGYNPEDLVKKPDLQAECRDAINFYAAATRDGPDSVIGAPYVDEDRNVFNAAYHIGKGKIQQVVKKHDLPNYGVFDDKRLFAAGQEQEPITVDGVKVGVMICEDTWFPKVSQALAKKGAEILISLNGSPYDVGKESHARMDVLHARVAETKLPILYVNQVGGQDGVVYDGHSLGLNVNGTIAWRAPGWAEHLGLVAARKDASGWKLDGEKAHWGGEYEQFYSALVLGTRDYMRKTGFKKAVIGLSGGADSALVAAVAVDAIGAENVTCVRLPSALTSEHSMIDAEKLAKNLGCKLTTLPITEIVKATGSALTSYFGGPMGDLTGQNIQARARGLLLMAITNQYPDHLLLTTGNKSEMAVGYATLYGDMCGGFNVLGDVYKTKVFKLMEWRNTAKPVFAFGPGGPVIPQNIIDKKPSAELKSGQTDESELGSYAVLDPVLEQIVENETPIRDIVDMGFDQAYVMKISDMVDRAQYKRRQAAPFIKVTSRALFGDRRYPITNGFRSSVRLKRPFAERIATAQIGG